MERGRGGGREGEREYWDMFNILFVAGRTDFEKSVATHRINIKGTVSRDFRLLVFFMNQFPPSTQVYPYGHFKFFRKFAEIFAAQGANGKIFNQKNCNNFVWTPLGSRVNIEHI